jgi:RNA polymerase sigma-70 factor (ECF subfamily)
MTGKSGHPQRLQRALDRLWDSACPAWPSLKPDRKAFEGYLFERVSPSATDEDIGRLCGADLLIVFACLERLPGAVDQFLSAFGPALAQQIRSIESRAEVSDEMLQELLARIFLPASPDGQPRIAAYSGRGPLRVWLKLAARRLALNARRNSDRLQLSESAGDRALSRITLDMEMSFIRGQYEFPFREAIRSGFKRLQPDQRTVLRLHYREGLSSSGLAIALRTSRPTAHRRLAAAREALVTHVRDELQRQLRVGPEKLEGLLELLSTNMVAVLTAELRSELG